MSITKNMVPVKVSICCLTYNHEKFIRDCIEGFLMQETNFTYEIIIHDDASTDSTASIIKEYQNKNIDIIHCILQKENKLSKGIKPSQAYVWPKAKGKYIALCEGDDFWTDPNKLQYQIDLMEKHKVDLSFHPSIIEEKENGNLKQNKKNYFHGKKLKKFSTNDILNKDGQVLQVPTASIIFKKNTFDDLIHKNPHFFSTYISHTIIVLIGSLKRKTLYIPRFMAVYRKGHDSSWTNRMKLDSNFRVNYNSKLIEAYKKFNHITKYKFNKKINKNISKRVFSTLKNLNIPLIVRSKHFQKNKSNIFFNHIVIWHLILKWTAIHKVANKTLNFFRNF